MCFRILLPARCSDPADKNHCSFNFFNFLHVNRKPISKHITYELQRQNLRIEKLLKIWKKSYNATVRLLVLGDGETGKSTFIRAIRVNHNYVSSDERNDFFYLTLQTIQEAMLLSLAHIQLNEFDLPIFHANVKYLETISTDKITRNDNLKLNLFYDTIEYFWKDSRVKDLLLNSVTLDFVLPENIVFLFDEIKNIRKTPFTITDSLMLRIRNKTSKIREYNLKINGTQFNIFDVGGQRDQRKKWIQCFDNITAIIFVADLSSFHKTCEEGVNALKESLVLFEQIWFNRYLSQKSVILLLNKFDTFTNDIVNKKYKISDYFPSYEKYEESQCLKENYYEPVENCEVTRGKLFILEQFLNITKTNHQSDLRENKFCIPFFTTSVNKENANQIFNDCQVILRHENLIQIGIL